MRVSGDVIFLAETGAAAGSDVDVRVAFGHAHDGRAYFVMEMLAGESLARRIESRGRLPEREAAEIARGIAGALGAAHGKGIVHRDLKPDNGSSATPPSNS